MCYAFRMEEVILIVDNDPQLTSLLKGYLKDAGYRTDEAQDGLEALKKLQEHLYQLVILDVMMPRLDGWGVLRALRGEVRWKNLPVILLTARVDETDKVVGLELGADDYITKPFHPRELVARVGAVLRRCLRVPEPPAVTAVWQRGALTVDRKARDVRVAGKEVALTKTEYSLLETFLDHPGHTLTREELLDRALGYSWEGLGRTLDTHIRNLRNKLEDREGQLLETVHGVGYRLRKEST